MPTISIDQTSEEKKETIREESYKSCFPKKMISLLKLQRKEKYFT